LLSELDKKTSLANFCGCGVKDDPERWSEMLVEEKINRSLSRKTSAMWTGSSGMRVQDFW